MTKERMERLMELYQGIGVETENGQHYFYEAFDSDFKGAVERVNHTFIGHKFGKYKVFIAQSEEVERMTNIYDEEVIVYETTEGDVVAILEDQAIRVFANVEHALDRLYMAGFRF